MATIDDIEITSLLFQEGSAPSTPASTKWRAYFKTDGLYVMDDAGNETGLGVSTGGSAPVPWNLPPYYGAAWVGNVNVGASNRCLFVPATLIADATLTGIQIIVGTQNGNISVALYDSGGNRVATSGAVACPASGLQSVSFSANYAASAGRYYLALSADGITATFGNSTTGASNASPGVRYQETAHPAPATASFAGISNSRAPAILGLISGGLP